MENQSKNLVRKVNRLAIIGLMIGLLSFLPYLPILIRLLFLALNELPFLYSSVFGRILDQIISAVPGIIIDFGGALFGLISLVACNIALKRIKTLSDIKIDYRIASIGKVISICGIVTDIGLSLLSFLFQGQ